jgi:hypothetical protein
MSDNDSGRREFCGAACRVLAAGGVASLLQACGSGGGGVTGPSNVSPLPIINGTASGNIVSVTGAPPTRS